MADPDIDTVLNLTVPAAHAAVNMQALKSGKHAYCEKPFALNYKEGLKVINEAKKRKLRLGCAPDTVLGGGIQTCRRLIDEGVIGRPIAAVANMLAHGPEAWHPNPDFFYQGGGGPMFDMGPYYLTSLVTMLGGVKSVMASSTISFKERVIGNKARFGEKIKVEVPTHLTGVLEFDQGAIATVSMSFDISDAQAAADPDLGTEGIHQLPRRRICIAAKSISGRPRSRSGRRIPAYSQRRARPRHWPPPRWAESNPQRPPPSRERRAWAARPRGDGIVPRLVEGRTQD